MHRYSQTQPPGNYTTTLKSSCKLSTAEQFQSPWNIHRCLCQSKASSYLHVWQKWERNLTMQPQARNTRNRTTKQRQHSPWKTTTAINSWRANEYQRTTEWKSYCKTALEFQLVKVKDVGIQDRSCARWSSEGHEKSGGTINSLNAFPMIWKHGYHFSLTAGERSS